MSIYQHYYLNRTLCDALDDMRRCDKHKNYSNLLSLIEEIQVLGNRMESKLNDIHDFDRLKEDAKRLTKEIRNLQQEKSELENE